MTPQEALQLLDNVTSQISLPRDGHVQVQTAINTLTQATEAKQTNDRSDE